MFLFFEGGQEDILIGAKSKNVFLSPLKKQKQTSDEFTSQITPFFNIVAIVVGLCFEDYGGEYHCWLQVNKPIAFYVIITTVFLVVLTFTAIEAAGK